MRRIVLLWGLLLLAPPATASADWHFSPAIGATILGNTSLADLDHGTGNLHLNLGGSVAYFTRGLFGLEAVGVWTPRFFHGQNDPQLVTSGRTLAMMGNVVITGPRRFTEYSLRPYVSGGFGVMHASLETIQAALDGNATHAGFDVGGGVIGFLTNTTGLRFDARYYSTLNKLGLENSVGPLHLRYFSATVGIVIRR